MDWIILLAFTIGYSFKIYQLSSRVSKLEDQVRELKKS